MQVSNLPRTSFRLKAGLQTALRAALQTGLLLATLAFTAQAATLEEFQQDMATVGSSPDNWGRIDINNFRLDGPVTAQDLARFRNQYQQHKHARPTINHKNGLGIIREGTRLIDAFGIMYEFTEDRFYIDRMIEFIDSIMIHRNDVRQKYRTATGNFEPFWPNYQGVEQESDPADIQVKINGFVTGVVVGRIANAARIMLEAESLQNQSVTVGDPHGFGKTYQQRANYYLDQCVYVLDNFFMKHWHEENSGRMVYPKNKQLIPAKNHKRAGVGPAWNRYFMITMGFARTAETLANRARPEDAERIATYDKVVQVSVNEFFQTSKPYTLAPVGKDHRAKPALWWPYDYYYEPVRWRAEEVGHAGLDLACLHPIYDTGRYGITAEQMMLFVNVTRHVLYDAQANAFYHSIEGAKGKRATADKPTLGSGYMSLSAVDPSMYLFIGRKWQQDRKIRKRGLHAGQYAELLYWKAHFHESEHAR